MVSPMPAEGTVGLAERTGDLALGLLQEGAPAGLSRRARPPGSFVVVVSGGGNKQTRLGSRAKFRQGK